MPTVDIWAPKADNVSVELLDGTLIALEVTDGGHFVTELPTGTRYSVRLDGGMPLPDPRSMRQPDGPHGPSEVVDPDSFEFATPWRGEKLGGKVFYELHIGTFTPEGTFRSAITKLDFLADLGVEVVEIMPVNPIPGKRGWGYDSVSIFALNEAYGSPEDLVALVDAIHARGMSACLDVVYNHFGPDGNYLSMFGPYFTDRHKTPWGDAVNFDGEDSDEVRQYILDNAMMWLRDYRFDALRLDATDYLIDDSPIHIMQQISLDAAKLAVDEDRIITLTAESDLNMPAMVLPVNQDGRGMDMQWTDDVHHALHVWLTGECNAYYVDYTETDTMATAFTHAFTRVGQKSRFSGESKGSPVPHDYSGHHFIVFDENHDQVGNRLISDRPTFRLTLGQTAVSRALILLSPFTPMLFMGEEWATRTPFHYFTDHGPNLGATIMAGRENEFANWDMRSVYGDAPVTMLDPQSERTFNESKLDWTEPESGDHARMLEFVRQLIALRRNEPDVATGDRSATMMHLRSNGGWLRRGSIYIVFSKDPQVLVVDLPRGSYETLLTWDASATVEQNSVDSSACVSLPGAGVVVLRRIANTE